MRLSASCSFVCFLFFYYLCFSRFLVCFFNLQSCWFYFHLFFSQFSCKAAIFSINLSSSPALFTYCAITDLLCGFRCWFHARFNIGKPLQIRGAGWHLDYIPEIPVLVITCSGGAANEFYHPTIINQYC